MDSDNTERLRELDERLSDKKLILLRGVEADLACKIRYDIKEIEREIEQLKKSGQE
jgi:hypothetical protein